MSAGSNGSAAAPGDGADPATVLVVDIGTGGPKIVLVSLSGRVIGSAHRRVEPRVGSDGSAVQDPTSWWTAVVEGAQELVDAHRSEMTNLAAVSVTGQWGSTVPVDAGGDPVGDCMLWMDTRGRSHARRVLGGRVSIEGLAPRAAIEWIRRSGGAPSTEGNDPLGHRLWIRNEQPDVYRATSTFLEPIDFITARFSGRITATTASMLLSWLTDNRHPDRAAYDPVLVKLAEVDSAKLPPLVPTSSVVGTVQPSVADQLGLPADVPVVASLPDLHTAALGSGALGLYQPHLSISTSAWVGCHTPDKTTSITHQMATVPSALPGRYVLANNHETAGVCVEWARNLLVLADDGLTRPAADTLADLDAVAAAAPSGSGGVLFAPWLNGERSPVADTHLRASFHNLSLSTTRGEMVRSVLEGVAHNARWLLEASETVVGHRLGGVRAIGGGAVSDVWCQIHSDVLGRPLFRVADPLLVNAAGGAFFAGLVLGLLDESDIAERVDVDRVFRPDPGAREVHDVLHDEFVGLASLEKGMYRRLDRYRRRPH